MLHRGSTFVLAWRDLGVVAKPIQQPMVQRRFACLSRTATTGAFSPTQL